MSNQGFFTRQQLLNVETQSQAVNDLLQFLTGSSFSNITDWGSGTFQQDLLQLCAFCYVAGQQRAATLCLQGVESTASGSFLDAISDSFFDNQRFNGAQTQGVFGLTASLAATSNTFASNQFVVTSNGLQFSNVDTLAIVSGQSLTASFIAALPGLGYNLANNTSILPLNPYPNLTINNPPLSGSTTWITTVGADAMTDQGLHVLNETTLSTLSIAASAPADRVINAVVSASGGAISDVNVDGSNPFGPGTVAVYCSFPMAPASAGEVSAISGTVAAIASFNPELVTVTSSIGMPFASGTLTNYPVQVFYAPGTIVSVLSASLVTACNNWLSGIPTGGNDYAGSLQSGSNSGIADVGGLAAQLYQVPGVRIVVVGNQQDIQLSNEQKLTAPFTDVNFNGIWSPPYLQLTASIF